MNGNGGLVERLTRSTAEMTPHERSAQADEMRRSLVELAAAHNRLVAVVDEHSAQVTALRRDIDAQTQCCCHRCDATSERDMHLDKQHRAFISRSFIARLRWIFLGR